MHGTSKRGLGRVTVWQSSGGGSLCDLIGWSMSSELCHASCWSVNMNTTNTNSHAVLCSTHIKIICSCYHKILKQYLAWDPIDMVWHHGNGYISKVINLFTVCAHLSYIKTFSETRQTDYVGFLHIGSSKHDYFMTDYLWSESHSHPNTREHLGLNILSIWVQIQSVCIFIVIPVFSMRH